MKPYLCLGSAQFGFDYGITNKDGQSSGNQIKILLSKANDSGIHFIDTAQDYGEAEDLIGRNLIKDHAFKFIGKFPRQNKFRFTPSDVLLWENQYHVTLKRLGINFLDSFLIHYPYDLKKPGKDILKKWLLSLKERHLVNHLGVSIYQEDDLNGVDDDFLESVQLPLSLYDQRLLNNGTIDRLKERGSEIHARSIYLQGLLLAPVEAWPNWVKMSTKNQHRNLEAYGLQNGFTLLEMALDFVRSQKNIDIVVVGLCNEHQLDELTSTWLGPSICQNNDWSQWSMHDNDILDPRFWPRA